MAPGDLLQPLEGQREETLRVIDSLTPNDLGIMVRGDGRTVHQLLCHLIDREQGINSAIRRALADETPELAPEARPELAEADLEHGAADWDLQRIRAELVEARRDLQQTFMAMTDDHLDLPLRWPEWPARTIRASIPYMLEHEDSHLDELREAIRREGRLVS